MLSATQDRGMVYRDENGINISHDKKNELTYKHVIPGQFVIHLRSFQGGFAHSAIEGITSPAYTVFKFSNASQHDDIFGSTFLCQRDLLNPLRRLRMVFEMAEVLAILSFLDYLLQFQKKKKRVALVIF